jgi:hypothetical protein
VCPSITNHFNHCCVSGIQGIQTLLRFRVFRYSITAAFQFFGCEGWKGRVPFNHYSLQSLLRFSFLVVKDGKGVCPSITIHFNHCCVSGYFGCEGLKGGTFFNQLRNDR